ncbi:MAG TPA: hypothetical protein VI112_16775 [Bacteroidia bacterium]|jgi:hypothetical protein
MAKTSTLKNIFKITEEELQPALKEQLNSKPSSHVISNILNYSRSLEMKTAGNGKVMLINRN